MAGTANRSLSSDGVDPQPVLQHDALDRSEELRSLLEAVNADKAFLARTVLDMGLICSAAELHDVPGPVSVRRVSNDLARHAGSPTQANAAWHHTGARRLNFGYPRSSGAKGIASSTAGAPLA